MSDKHRKQFKSQDELVYYAFDLIKINKAERHQMRTLIITNKALYNYEKTSMKKCIPYEEVYGITISSKSNEFVVHGKPGVCYDYRYVEKDIREQLISYIVYAYNQHMGNYLRIWFVEDEKLQKYFTQEKELNKNISLMPKHDHQEGRYETLNIIMSNSMNPDKNQKVLYINDKNKYKIALENFKIRYILDEGSICKSILMVHFAEKETVKYVCKYLPFSVLGKQNEESLKSAIQNHRNYNFIEQLEFAFRKHSGFYFIFKLMQGGDLLTHIHLQKRIQEANAKFYFIEILIGLNHFHSRNIIYGDLKPENVLLDEEGHLNLTDFGQCRCLDKDDDQFLNITLEYTAPEILLGQPRSQASDYWALGCLLYEMVVGIAPFYNENNELVVNLIIQNELKFPSSDDKKLHISDHCKEIITSLLNSDPAKRPNLQTLKQFEWLKGEQWIEYENKKKTPPFRPDIKDNKTNPDYFTKIKHLKSNEKEITIVQYYNQSNNL